MQAIKDNEWPAGNSEKGKIVEIKTDCSHCGKENGFIVHRINPVTANTPIYKNCIHCSKELLITNLI